MGNTRYISVDIEADGPIPGDNSMLSIGAAAFEESGEPVGTIPIFSINLAPLPKAVQDVDTMKFWLRNAAAWNASRENTVLPYTAMLRLVRAAIGIVRLPGAATVAVRSCASTVITRSAPVVMPNCASVILSLCSVWFASLVLTIWACVNAPASL